MLELLTVDYAFRIVSMDKFCALQILVVVSAAAAVVSAAAAVVSAAAAAVVSAAAVAVSYTHLTLPTT